MKGCIIERIGKNGALSFLIKYDSGKDPATGKRHTHYKTVRGTKKDAQKELRRLLGSVDKGEHVRPDRLTLSEWVKTWLEITEPTVSAKTFERYEELLRLHVIPSLGGTVLQRLTGVQIETLYSKLRTEGQKRRAKRKADDAQSETKTQEPPKRGLSERTMLHVHRVLSQCLSEAARKHVIARNPIQEVRSPRPEARRVSESDSRDPLNALDRDRLNALLKGLEGDTLYPMAALAAATGMRRGEILALRWSDIDQERKTVRVERSVEETNTKGARIKAPKNKSSKRSIGIDNGTAALLRRHWQSQAETSLKLGIRLTPDLLVFPKTPMEPSTPIAPRVISKRFSHRARALGFPGFRFHDLRHTHATLLLSNGVPVNAVAQRLGHSKPTLTLDVYGHLLRRSEAQAVSVTADFLDFSVEGKKV